MENPFMRIPLTKHKFALVDLEDYQSVSGYKWQARHSKGNYYAVHSTTDGEVSMHNFLLGRRDGLEIDHINQNGLDNRRYNLRYATKSQNRANVARRSDNASGFKGVSFNKRNNKWIAYININHKRKHLGYFSNIKEAAQAYNNASVKYFGEFGCVNQVN